jgi:hypothetical protein
MNAPRPDDERHDASSLGRRVRAQALLLSVGLPTELGDRLCVVIWDETRRFVEQRASNAMSDDSYRAFTRLARSLGKGSST